ncbi:MAG: UvrD-helicase domain-containing protein [Flavobacteriaceae bacterium]|nr:UvrD-helicase domain-containing protein [Flavobacteriaceae bacterium]
MSFSNSRFRVVIASAGSGKTSIIAKSYLTQLLRSKDRWPFKKQLALTFTNKAVDEMKTRILDHLAEFSKGQNLSSHVAQYIYQQLEISSDELQLKSSHMLKSILKDYGAFQVITLDKFTNRIVQMFSKDLKLPQNFKIELNLKKMVNDIVESLVWEVNEKDENLVTKKFKMFCQEISSRGETWDQLQPIKKLCYELYSENNLPYVEKIKKLSEDELNTIEKTLITNRDVLQKKMFQLVDKLLEEIRFIDNKLNDGQKVYFKEAFDVKRRELIQYKSADYSSFLSLRSNKHLTDQFHSYRLEMEEYAKKFTLYNKILKNWGPFSMLQLLSEKISEFQQSESRMLLSELNQKVGYVVKNSPTPFIYERFGEKYKHYFLDEFQDTSMLQWNNLIPLIDNVLEPMDQHETDPSDHLNPPGSLILVGDPKQAIYRWRGGKSEQLLDLETKAIKPFQIEQRVETLDTNYRSGANIIQFNNALYEFASKLFRDEQFTSVFTHVQQRVGGKTGGYIRVEMLDPKRNIAFPKEDKDFNIKNLEKQVETEAELFQNYNLEEKLEFLSKKERHLLLQNEKGDDIIALKVLKAIMESKIKGYSYSEIAILVRTNKQSTIIAQELFHHQIPFISEGSLKLENSPEVLLIIDLLELCVSPNDKAILKRIAQKLWYHHEELKSKIDYHDFVSQLIAPQDSPKSKNQKKSVSTFQFFHRLKLYYKHSFSWFVFKNLSLYESVEYAIWKIDFLDYRKLALTYFQEDVYEFASEKSVTVYEYLDYWHFNKSELSFESPTELDAIQVLTIHKAKGLEFPVVILPYATRKFKLLSGISDWAPIEDQGIEIPLKKVWIPISSDLEKFTSENQVEPNKSLSRFYKKLKSDVLNEEMNNFYVATTRASESLFIFSEFPAKKTSQQSLEKLFDHFFKLNEFAKSAFESVGIYQHASIFEIGDFEKSSSDKYEKQKPLSKQMDEEEDFMELDISTSLRWINKITKQTDIQSKLSIQTGNEIHSIMEHIKVPSDIDYAMQINSELYWDNPKLEQQIRQIIEKIVNHQELSLYFNQDSSKVICETGIIMSEKNMQRDQLSRIKPDRIVLFEDRTVLIDYKMTYKMKNDPVNKEYFEQLNGYGDVLKQLYQKPVEKYLVYIEWIKSNVKVIEVD